MGTPEVKIYDLNRVTFNFAGIPIESGFGEGEVIKAERLKPDFTTKEGADGSVTRSKTGSKQTKVTVVLLQSAAGNAVFSAIRTQDLLANNGAGVAPLLVTDLGGLSVLKAGKAWIEGPPAQGYGAEAGMRIWTIIAADADQFDGGN